MWPFCSHSSRYSLSHILFSISRSLLCLKSLSVSKISLYPLMLSVILFRSLYSFDIWFLFLFIFLPYPCLFIHFILNPSLPLFCSLHSCLPLFFFRFSFFVSLLCLDYNYFGLQPKAKPKCFRNNLFQFFWWEWPSEMSCAKINSFQLSTSENNSEKQFSEKGRLQHAVHVCMHLLVELQSLF